ncbi:MAG: T9SS type A sorting domain-containing protein, partial [Flavobacteriaceae bacterium]
VNWVEQAQTATLDGSSITALDISKYPVANKLYYGTNSGGIYRVENANLDDQPAVDVSTGKGLPQGYVSNIYVDQKNSNRVFAVFSNYGIPSVFMSRNAGETWRDISGNLEENRDGSGNGPSVRWFAMNGKNDGYFVGTSTGLYYAPLLRGKNTYWFREPLRIGNGVVTQVKTRKDGFVAAAVHGNGVYSANFYVRPRPEPTLSVAYLLPDITVAMNSDPFEVDITDLFVSSKNRDITIELTNSNPGLVSASLQGDKVVISITPDMKGSAAIGLIATSKREKVSEGFTINVFEPAIYQQVGPLSSSTPSQNFLDFGGIAQSADDFTVPEGSRWNIRELIAFGGVNGAPQLVDATVALFTDNNGVPGDEIYNSGSIVPSSDPSNPNLSLELPEVVTLESGSYWISIYTNLAFAGGNQWFWFTQSEVIGNESAFKDNLDLFGLGATSWTPRSTAFGTVPDDMTFQLFGTIEEFTDEEANIANTIAQTPDGDLEPEENENLAVIESNVVTAVWPNPSTDQFHFAMRNSPDKTVTTRIFNVLGQLVYEKQQLDSGKSFSWDASESPAGIYFVKITGAKTDKRFKIIKKE